MTRNSFERGRAPYLSPLGFRGDERGREVSLIKVNEVNTVNSLVSYFVGAGAGGSIYRGNIINYIY